MGAVDRDHALELELLERAGGTPEFNDEVLRRLDHYESLHGNTGWDVDVDDLLQEAQEEAADISGWGPRPPPPRGTRPSDTACWSRCRSARPRIASSARSGSSWPYSAVRDDR